MRIHDLIPAVKLISDLDRLFSSWSIGDRDFEVTRTLDNKNAKIAICDIAIQSQSLSQDQIWMVDLTPYRSFMNQDFEVTKAFDNKNVDFMICDIVMQSQPLNRE
jgi:hypothetical protein